MFIRSENDSLNRPPEIEQCGESVIVRRNFKEVPAGEEKPAHYSYEEWQMGKEAYEVYKALKAENDVIGDAVIELAELVVGG